MGRVVVWTTGFYARNLNTGRQQAPLLLPKSRSPKWARLLNLVHLVAPEMAKRSQIITVTHNKHTMEVAKRLYGVTMEEKGISKMVSVNLSDAQVVAEA
jgi:hypothetical protein